VHEEDHPAFAASLQEPATNGQGLLEGSAVLLVAADGRVLLQQRDDDVPPAGVGRWAVPGGARTGEESPVATALREFEEETAVRLRSLRHFATYDPAESPWMKHFLLHLFIAQDDVPIEDVKVLEGIDFRYWTPEEALALPVNPTTSHFLRDVLGSPAYEAAKARRATAERWVSVLEIDRWGRVLLLRPADTGPGDSWSIPGGPARPGESPDQAALRRFEELTGHTLETLKLYRALRREPGLPTGPAPWTHVYYHDADLHLPDLSLPPGAEATYAGLADVHDLQLPDYARTLLVAFFESPAYKAMFH
jgi:8-oxo-dGTP diphosphatase